MKSAKEITAQFNFLTEYRPRKREKKSTVQTPLHDKIEHFSSAIIKEEVNLPEYIEVDDKEAMNHDEQRDPVDTSGNDIEERPLYIEIEDDDSLQEADLFYTHSIDHPGKNSSKAKNIHYFSEEESDSQDESLQEEASSLEASSPHLRENLYECDIGQKSFPSQPTNGVNLKIHNEEKPPSRKEDQRSAQSDSPDPSDGKPTFTCPACPCSFFTYNDIVQHLNTHSQQRQKCEGCKRRFALLENHIKRCPAKKKNNVSESSPSSPPEENNEKRRISLSSKKIYLPVATEELYKCAKCPNMFTGKFEVLEHLETHSEEKSNKRKKLKTSEKFQTLYKCVKCRELFSEKERMVYHMRRFHTEAKPHQCPVCSKLFSRTYDLMRHLRYHGEAKLECRKSSYKCPKCGRSFSKAEDLVKHVKIHTVEYKCPDCPLSYMRPCDLMTHSRTHDRLKLIEEQVREVQEYYAEVIKNNKYNCKTCNQAFCDKSTLMLHQKSHKEIKKTSTMKLKSAKHCSFCD